MAEIWILFSISSILFLSPFLSRYLYIPTPSVEIILGAIAAYYGFVNDFYLFELTAHVGFFYLMFMAGTEVDLKMFVSIPKDVLKKGVVYLLLLYIFSSISVLYLELHPVLIIIIPTLSVGLILALYKDYGKNTNWLNLSMLIGTMGELISISLLTFAGAALNFGIGLELYRAVTYLLLLLVALVIVFKFLHVLFWWYPEIKIFLMPHTDKEEKDLRLSMALFFIMIGIMLMLHLEVAFGAFLAGIFIATFFDHKKELPHKISSFGFGFLVPIFFIYIGSTLDLQSLRNDNIIQLALLITVLMLGVRIISAFVFAQNLKTLDIFRYALSQAMPLTLMIAIATIAYNSQTIDNILYAALILSAVLEVIIVMVSIKILSAIDQKKAENIVKK
ncbi:MAG: cation:proton antiporter [Sulfurospirillum sp.]|nr:cation:proton antiporter [Sulfurospirillum sp.]